MDSILRIAALALGIGIVAGTAFNVFTALVVPRATSSRVLRAIARVLGGSARASVAPPPDAMSGAIA